MSQENNKVSNFKSGDTIYNEKTPAEHLYIIQSGEVGVFKRGKSGKKVPIAIVRSNQFLGELSMIQGRDRTSTAVALSDVTALKVGKKEFNKQIDTASPWLKALLGNMVERLQATNDVLRRNGFVDRGFEEELAEYLAKNEDLKNRLNLYEGE